MNTASHYLQQFPPIIRANFLLEFKRDRGVEFKDSCFSTMYYRSADNMLLKAFNWDVSVVGFTYWFDIYNSLILYRGVVMEDTSICLN